MDHFLFIFNNVFVCAVSALAATLAMRDREPWRRVFAAVAGIPIVAYGTLLFLGSIGLLATENVSLVLVALTGVLAQLNRNKQVAFGTGDRPLTIREDAVKDLRWFLAMTSLVALVFLPFTRAAFTGPTFGTDDLSYHAPQVAHWIIAGDLSPANGDYSAYYPYNAEMLNLWFILPLRSDAFAALAGAYWLLLLVLAIIRLCPSGGHGRSTPLLMAAVAAASAVVALEARRFAGTGLVGTSAVLAGVAFLIPTVRPGREERTVADLVYAGLLCGFAAGSKISFSPVCVVIAVWLFFTRRYQLPNSVRLKQVLVFLGAATLTGGYWYIRNIVQAGNPLFPAQLGPLSGPFLTEYQDRTKLITWILANPFDIAQWKLIIKAMVSWPISLFPLAAAGYGAAAWMLLRRRSGVVHDRQDLHVLLFAIGIVFLLAFPFTPFSGTDDSPGALLRVENRFLVLPFAIGLVLFSPLVSRADGAGNFWFTLSFLALVIGGAQPGAAVLVVMLIAGMLYLLVTRMKRLLSLWSGRWILALGTAAVGIAALTLWEPMVRQATDYRLFSYGNIYRPIGNAWKAADSLAAGSTISWFGPSMYMHYPLYGRRYHLRPMAVNPDGTLLKPLHERWKQDPSSVRWWEGPEAPDLTHLSDNLIRSGIDYVIVSRWDGDSLPPQYQALAASGRWRTVFDDEYSSIWKRLDAQ